MADSAVTSSAAPCAPPPQTIIGFFAAPRSFAALRIAVLVELGPRRRQRRLRRHRARFAPDVDRAFERGRARPARSPSRASPRRPGAAPASGFRMQRGVIDQPRDDAGLVADLVQVAEAAADVGVRDFADQRQHRRVHRIGGEQRGRGIEQARPRHHGIGLRLAGRERGAERHIGRALFVPGVHGADPVADGLEQRVEQVVVLHARQRVDRVDAVARACASTVASAVVIVSAGGWLF